MPPVDGLCTASCGYPVDNRLGQGINGVRTVDDEKVVKW
jgi:hypothetical protein